MRELALRILTTGIVAGVASAAAAMAGARRDHGHAVRPINAIAHIYDGGPPPAANGRHNRNTLLGFALHTAASVWWAAFYEALRPRSRSPGAAIAVSAAAYIVDYYVVSRRFRPGFERYLSRRSLFAVYAALAAGFIASPARGRPSGPRRPRARPRSGSGRR
ncbi:MAG TPA: hypothetical protein VD965_09660 [Burkholderiales bacterium]|nr:hypothetical protein [Burkholderiales bacterium]